MTPRLAILISLFACSTPTWFLNYEDMTWWDWFISDTCEYIAFIFAYLALFYSFPYKEFIPKFASLILAIGAGFNLVNFLAQAANNEPNMIANYVFLSYKLIAFFLIIKVWFAYNKVRGEAVAYQPGQSYLVIKMPTSFKSLLIAIRYFPSDTVQFIHREMWWKMNGKFKPFGIREERLKHYWLIPIAVDSSFERRFDKMIGSKFNLFRNNCFHVYKRVV